VFERDTVRDEPGDIFSALQRTMTRYHQAPGFAGPLDPGGDPATGAGLTGGFVGYLGYNAVRHLERLPLAPLPPDFPDESRFDLFTNLVRFDHARQSLTIIHNVIIDPTVPLQDQYLQARMVVDTLALRLRRAPLDAQHFSCDLSAAREDTGREEFCAAVRAAQRHIVDGDIFQVVLSRRVRYRYRGDLFALYRALRIVNPSPYLFFLDFGRTTLIGSSPEVLVRVGGRTVEVLPIAGTRPRGTSEQEDRDHERDLLADRKEIAEHVMLVDLGRNDVGRISEYGSVEVPVLQRVDRYSHVMHIVSHVRGILRNDLDAIDALRACFPAGTVSGAPKVRAMEIIHALEPIPRGVYAGAVGYYGFDRSLDTCIAIRTFVAHDGTLSIQAGAGIVADSIPESEYQESVNKARALIEALMMASQGLSGFRDGGKA
jgi:anthranilate synthase component 1